MCKKKLDSTFSANIPSTLARIHLAEASLAEMRAWVSPAGNFMV